MKFSIQLLMPLVLLYMFIIKVICVTLNLIFTLPLRQIGIELPSTQQLWEARNVRCYNPFSYAKKLHRYVDLDVMYVIVLIVVLVYLTAQKKIGVIKTISLRFFQFKFLITFRTSLLQLWETQEKDPIKLYEASLYYSVAASILSI